MRSLRALSSVAIVAAALLAPASASADGTVAVQGSATLQVQNDAASIGLSVSKERRARAAALRATSIRLRAVIAAVQTVPGVGPGDIATGQISVREARRGERTIYRASEGIAVILHQPDRAGELINAAIAAGATGTRGPSFFPSDPNLAYDNALLAAFDRARAKAAALAARAGAILGPAVSIEEGVDITYPPSSPMATTRGSRGSDKAAPPAKPGTSTVTATVRAIFALQ